MAADGTSVNHLTDTPGKQHSGNPSWSPDGKRILFGSTRDQSSDNPLEAAELYVMDADGSNVQRLTFNDAFDGHPRWQPLRR